MTEIASTTITPKELRIIVADWKEELSGLAVWKKSWLIRRVGPVAIGVCIDVLGGRWDYRPTAFGTKLYIPTSHISFGTPQYWAPKGVQETIKPKFHDRHYRTAAAFLRDHAYVRLLGPVSLDHLVSGYERYLRDNQHREYAEIPWQIRLLAQCRAPEAADRLLSRVKRAFKPEDFHWAGGRDALVETLTQEIADPTILDGALAQKVADLGFDTVPNEDLIY
jgi:hypothetical protein